MFNVNYAATFSTINLCPNSPIHSYIASLQKAHQQIYKQWQKLQFENSKAEDTYRESFSVGAQS